jgi:hypothetical protein
MADLQIQNPGFDDPTRVQRSPEFRSIYFNAVKLRVSVYEISVILGRQAEIAPGVEGAVEEGVLVMSPQQGKALALALTNAVANYESQFGLLNHGPVPAMGRSSANRG